MMKKKELKSYERPLTVSVAVVGRCSLLSGSTISGTSSGSFSEDPSEVDME
jgi:hypothetical protein